MRPGEHPDVLRERDELDADRRRAVEDDRDRRAEMTPAPRSAVEGSLSGLEQTVEAIYNELPMPAIPYLTRDRIGAALLKGLSTGQIVRASELDRVRRHRDGLLVRLRGAEAEVERLHAEKLAVKDRLGIAILDTASVLRELRCLAWSLLNRIDRMALRKAQQRALDEPVAALRAALDREWEG